MREIPLTRGKVALVDDDDFEKLNKHSWHCKDNGYAASRIRDGETYKCYFLHRIIMDAKKGEEVDHIDGNRLNNQKTNLRICLTYQNRQNVRRHIDNKTGFKGVSLDKITGKFCARIMVRGREIWLGRHNTAEEAYAFYKSASILYHGEYSKLN